MLCIVAGALVFGRRPAAPEQEPAEDANVAQHFMALPYRSAWTVIILCAVLWTVGFVLFVWFKKTPDGWPYWYVAATVPLVSAAVCGLLMRWYTWWRVRA